VADDVVDDLAEDLRTRLHRDPHVLIKNSALFESVLIAYIADGLEWARCRDVLRELKMIKEWGPKFKSAMHKVRGIREIGEPGPGLPLVIGAWDPPAPVSEYAEIPKGYGVNGSGNMAIFQRIERTVDHQTVMKDMCVSYDPIIIRRRIRHVDQKKILLELAWLIDKHWHTGIYDRDDVFKRNSLVNAAADGAPVRDDNALDVLKFIGIYEHHNFKNIDTGYASSSMGWKGTTDDPTRDGFLCGNKHMCRTKESKNYILRPMGPGDEEEAKTVRGCGSFDAWKAAVAPCGKYPAVRIGFYAGLASVMLPILDAPNAIVEWVKGTSTGKTRVLEVTLSLWRSPRSPLVSWDNTNSNFESKAHLFSGFPLMMDDTKAVTTGQGKKGEEILGKNIYKYINGIGRGRDQRNGGQRATIKWKGVLFSTGEIPSSDLCRAEGAAARVLSFWTAPWGKHDPETGKLIERVLVELGENYGHAGPAFVQWLHDNRKMWPQLRSAYDETTLKIRDMFDSPAAMRLARVIALLEVTAAAAHMAGIFPWPARSLLEDEEIKRLLTASVAQAESGADDATRAWEHVLSEAESRQTQWIPWGEEPNKNAEPTSGWLGWRDATKCLGFNLSKLRQILENGGFSNDAICRALKERGMIASPTKPALYTKVVKLGSGRKVRLVCLMLDESKWRSSSEDPDDDPGDDDSWES